MGRVGSVELGRFSGDFFPLFGGQSFRPRAATLLPSEPPESYCVRILTLVWILQWRAVQVLTDGIGFKG